MAKPVKQAAFQIVWFWLFLRILTSLVAALFSPLYPRTLIEKHIPFWPPAADFFAWLNRVIVAPWIRWDVDWFRKILTQGYTAGDGTTSFHPLYPLLSYPLFRLGVDPTLSLLITSTLAALALFWIFHKLAGLDLDPVTAQAALLFFATFPVAFILFAPYTESLFLLWTALALYTMRRGRWGLAAAASFLATLTRQQGLFLAIPMAWWAWEASGKSLRGIKKAWAAWLSTLAAPAALLAFSIYRIGFLHEGGVDFNNLQSLIYSAIFSPANYKVVVGQAFTWPWKALAIAVEKIIHHPEVNVIANLTLGLGFLVAFIIAWKHLNIADRLYCLVILVISFSFTTGDIGYMSLPRHLFIALPVFIGLAAALRKPWQKSLLISLQLPVMLFLLVLYVFIQWIP